MTWSRTLTHRHLVSASCCGNPLFPGNGTKTANPARLSVKPSGQKLAKSGLGAPNGWRRSSENRRPGKTEAQIFLLQIRVGIDSRGGKWFLQDCTRTSGRPIESLLVERGNFRRAHFFFGGCACFASVTSPAFGPDPGLCQTQTSGPLALSLRFENASESGSAKCPGVICPRTARGTLKLKCCWRIDRLRVRGAGINPRPGVRLRP